MVHFYNIFVFQNLLKNEAVLKIPFFCEAEEFEERRPVPALTIPFPFLFSFSFPEPALTIPLPVNKFLNQLAPKLPNNILISNNVLLFHFQLF